MSKKATLIFILVLLSLVATLELAGAQTSAGNAQASAANAQTSSPTLIALSSSQLNFYGTQQATYLNRTANIVGLVNQNVTVAIVSDELYNNSTGTIIPYTKVEIAPANFTLSKNEAQKVSFSIKTSGARVGTYQGTFLVTATTDTLNVTVTNIGVTAKIDIEHQTAYKYLLLGGIVVLIFAAFMVADNLPPKNNNPSPTPEQIEFTWSEFKKAFTWKQFKDSLFSVFICKGGLVILLGFFAVILWVILITYSALSFTDPGNIISTALIVPFVAYLIYFIKPAGQSNPEK